MKRRFGFARGGGSACRPSSTFAAAVLALDRLLLSALPVAPLFHTEEQWVAYKSWMGRPEEVPLFGIADVTPVEPWWRKREG